MAATSEVPSTVDLEDGRDRPVRGDDRQVFLDDHFSDGARSFNVGRAAAIAGRSFSRFEPADIETISKRSGKCATTESAESPMEPVAPRRAMRFFSRSRGPPGTKVEGEQQHGRSVEQASPAGRGGLRGRAGGRRSP